MFYIYLLQSSKDKTFYIGQTNNIEKRLKRHNNGFVRSTKNKTPWILIGWEECSNRDDARWREYDLKEHSDKRRKFIDKLMLP